MKDPLCLSRIGLFSIHSYGSRARKGTRLRFFECGDHRTVSCSLIQTCDGANADTLRRTGITLAQGRRDEHGMEEVDGLFSSPEKSPTKPSGFEEDQSDDSVGSDMSMDEGRMACQFEYFAKQSLTCSTAVIRQCAWPSGLSQSFESHARVSSSPAPSVTCEAFSSKVSCVAIFSRTGK